MIYFWQLRYSRDNIDSGNPLTMRADKNECIVTNETAKMKWVLELFGEGFVDAEKNSKVLKEIGEEW